MADDLKDCSVIMLCGSQCSGKTQVFHKVLSKDFDRFSASDLFRDNPAYGLRYATSRVVQMLNEHKKVVVDDENLSPGVRAAYLTHIRNKVADCRIASLQIKPKFGDLQRQFTYQIRLAEKVLDEDQSEISEKNELSDSKLVTPHLDEGFDKVVSMETLLQCTTSQKFEVPCLFMEFGEMFDTGGNILAGVLEALRLWSGTYTYGRICLLHRGNIQSSLCESKLDVVTEKVAPLTPVYLLTSNQTCDSDYSTVQDLMFLYRLHLCNLQHPGSIYCGTLRDGNESLKVIGLKAVKMKTILKSPNSILRTTSTSCPIVPDILEQLQIVKPAQDCETYIPLYSHAKTSSNLCKHRVDTHRWLYLIYSSFKSLERYNNSYNTKDTIKEDTKSKAQPGKQTVSSKKQLPTWMLPKELRPKVEKDQKVCKKVQEEHPDNTCMTSENKNKQKVKRKCISKSSKGLPVERGIQAKKRRHAKPLEFASSDSDAETMFDDFNRTMADVSARNKQSGKGATRVCDSSSTSGSDVSYISDQDVELNTCKSPVYVSQNMKRKSNCARIGVDQSPVNDVADSNNKSKTYYEQLEDEEPIPNSSVNGLLQTSPLAGSILDDLFGESDVKKKKPPPKKQRLSLNGTDGSLIDFSKTADGQSTISLKKNCSPKTKNSNNIDYICVTDDPTEGATSRVTVFSPESERKRQQALEALNALDEIF